MFLDCIVESRLVLYITGVDLSTVLEEVQAQLDALHGVDETRTAVVIGFKDVRTAADEERNDLQMRHEAGATNWS